MNPNVSQSSEISGKKKLGLIVNPVAGMGGRVGMKGTDGGDAVKKAKLLGATPEAPQRDKDALRVISRIREKIQLFTYPKEMGEEEATQCGFRPSVIGSIKSGETSSEDTRRAAAEMKNLGVDLLLFAGGDGTARDIYTREVIPARLELDRVAAHYAVLSLFETFDDESLVYCYDIRRRDLEVHKAGRARCRGIVPRDLHSECSRGRNNGYLRGFF